MRILHLISQRPDSTGSGSYLQAMLREAGARRHRNFLVAGIEADRPAELDSISPRDCVFVRFGGGDVAYPIVGMSDVMPYRSTRFSDLSMNELAEYEQAFTRALHAATATFRPDLIHSHHLWIVTALARRSFPHLPVVATCHGSDLRQFQNCPQLAGRVLEGCRQLDAIMALSEAQRREIVGLYDVPFTSVSVVGAGYDDRRFTAGPKPFPDPVHLVFAGKLSNAKGLPWLLRALSTVASPPWVLHLVGGGSGPETEACLALARGLPEVILHGAVSPQALAAIMRQAHILVLPSLFEGLGLVVLEGLASGCRIVATRLPGIIEVLGTTRLECVSLVEPPRLHSVDQPFHEDEARFEQNIAGALHTQMLAAQREPDIDLLQVRERLAAFSWPRVFEKVEQVYLVSRDQRTRWAAVTPAYPWGQRVRRLWNWLRGKRIILADQRRGRIMIRTGSNSATRSNGAQWYVQLYDAANGLPPLPACSRGSLDQPVARFLVERVAGEELARARRWYEARFGPLREGQELALVRVSEVNGPAPESRFLRYGPKQLFEAEHPWMCSAYSGPAFMSYFGTWYGSGLIGEDHVMDFEMFCDVRPGWQPFSRWGASWR